MQYISTITLHNPLNLLSLDKMLLFLYPNPFLINSNNISNFLIFSLIVGIPTDRIF